LSFRIRRLYLLPDAILWGSAKRKNTLLFNRNSNDFPDSDPDIRFPYRL
jgi:hypothetical protein